MIDYLVSLSLVIVVQISSPLRYLSSTLIVELIIPLGVPVESLRSVCTRVDIKGLESLFVISGLVLIRGLGRLAGEVLVAHDLVLLVVVVVVLMTLDRLLVLA